MALLAASQALVLVELGLVVGLLAGVLTWLGRRARAVDPGVLRTIRLSPQHVVYVVAIEDRRLLLGAGPGSAPGLICDLTETPRADTSRAETSRSETSRAGRESGPRTEPARTAATIGAGSRSRAGWDHGG